MKRVVKQVFGNRPPGTSALAQYERALIQERVVAGMLKAAVCRNFGVKRTTLIETLARLGWTGSREGSSR